MLINLEWLRKLKESSDRNVTGVGSGCGDGEQAVAQCLGTECVKVAQGRDGVEGQGGCDDQVEKTENG